jgi:hypothetical protein
MEMREGIIKEGKNSLEFPIGRVDSDQFSKMTMFRQGIVVHAYKPST